ncbi:MAG: hypothetical protein ISR69_04625 [Gammaproteobacteria bacterium]|nr:hypothetical protein [Gammaproteobacteria bacterium]
MSSFAPIGCQSHTDNSSFWPSFTDIMMVVVMIFLFATSILIVRNYYLVAELQDSLEAEKLAEQKIETTTLENVTLEQRLNHVESEIANATQENATLEERLTNYEQENSLLRLQILAKQERIKRNQLKAKQQSAIIKELDKQNILLLSSIKDQDRQLQEHSVSISELNTQKQKFQFDIASLTSQLNNQQQQIDQQTLANQQLTVENTNLIEQSTQAQTQLQVTSDALVESNQQVYELEQSNEQNQETITLLKQQRESYNAELLTLKGDYEVVKAKYQKLIKPARSAKGKYIAEVHYIKSEDKNQISYKEPGDTAYTIMELDKVETKLNALKAKYGRELYVKIIIPKNSGLTYSEAWTFMKNLLDKYDYYYQKSAIEPKQ